MLDNKQGLIYDVIHELLRSFLHTIQRTIKGLLVPTSFRCKFSVCSLRVKFIMVVMGRWLVELLQADRTPNS